MTNTPETPPPPPSLDDYEPMPRIWHGEEPPAFSEDDGRDRARWIIYQPATVRPGRRAA